jgi:hypothetical protein
MLTLERPSPTTTQRGVTSTTFPLSGAAISA